MSLIAITLTPESNCTQSREESFPIPLKYIDVSRTTHTNLDVMQESRIDDYWNIDGSRDLSDPWTGFTQFTLLSEKPPEGFLRSGERLTKRQPTSRPDHLWPELWRGLARNANLREKQKLAIEKPKLDNAGRLRGIYFIDPEDKEFKETIKNARKKLETPMAPAMPCKISKNNQYIDVTRRTHTSLDAWTEKDIDDCCNVDGERQLSDAWTGFHKIHFSEREAKHQ